MLRILVISLFVVNLLLFGFWDNQPAVQPKASVKPTVAEKSNIPTIHLFSEMVEDQGLMSGNRQCFSLGPFHSVEEMDEVSASLLEVTVNITERQTQALVEQGYWVYLPPYKDLVEANQVLFSLQALGLKDIGVIYNGEWTNAISLGYFRRQENAAKRKKSLEDRDYSPLIRVRRQAEDRFWLDYEQNPGSDLIALNMQDRPNDFMQRGLPCPEQVAPAQPVAQPLEQVATAIQEPLVLSPEDDDSDGEEIATTLTEDDEPEPEETDPAPFQDVDSVLEESAANQAVDNDTQTTGGTDPALQEGIDTGTENVIQAADGNNDTSLEKDPLNPEEIEGLLPEDNGLNPAEDDDPYDGDETDFDAG